MSIRDYLKKHLHVLNKSEITRLSTMTRNAIPNCIYKGSCSEVNRNRDIILGEIDNLYKDRLSVK